MRVALLLLLASLVALAAAQGAGSASACASQQVVSLGSFAGKVLSLSFPRTSDIVIQAMPGAGWGVTIYADAARLPTLTAVATASGNTLNVAVTDSAAPAPGTAAPRPPTGSSSTGSAASALAPASVAALCVLCALLSLAGLASGRLSPVACLVVVALPLALAVPPALYYCQRGTVIVTYPPGAELFVNGMRYPTCSGVGGAAPVATPILYNATTNSLPVKFLGTAWFASPAVVDLDMDAACTANCKEVIACTSNCKVYNDNLDLLQTLTVSGRVYAPQCVADLDGNGKMDLCAASGTDIYCWEWQGATTKFTPRAGFPRSIKGTAYPLITGGEIRGMGCGDLEGDGLIDIVVSTTNSAIQVYALDAAGNFKPGWPRYNTLTGPTNDANPGTVTDGINSFGHYRYGSYGLNVGIGNMDDDSDLEIIGTYDDHQIQAFKVDGQGINVASYFKQLRSPAKGQPVTWGQATPRWTNITTDHYQWNAGANGNCYANPVSTPCVPGGDPWLQFTQSPGSVMDIDGDGKAEVISLPNNEVGSCCGGGSYKTTARALFVLDGAYGNGGNPRSTAAPRSGLRKAGFDGEFPPMGNGITCPGCFDSTGSCNAIGGTGSCRIQSFYPPQSVPSPAFADLSAAGTLSIVFSYGDGTVSAYSAAGVKAWTFDFAADSGVNIQQRAYEASEPVIADLNADGTPEIVFATFGVPTNPMSSVNNQALYCISSTGTLLWRVWLNTAAAGVAPTDNANGNGAGAAGAPTIADINGDGVLEILLHTFDGRLLVYTVPGSQTNCLVWPTGRGGYLRKGQPDVNYSG